jgi:hypothetical protein
MVSRHASVMTIGMRRFMAGLTFPARERVGQEQLTGAKRRFDLVLGQYQCSMFAEQNPWAHARYLLLNNSSGLRTL